MKLNGRSDLRGRFGGSCLNLFCVFWSFGECENGGSYRSWGMDLLRKRRVGKENRCFCIRRPVGRAVFNKLQLC